MSSRPEVHPSQIVRVIKGRWVYLSRATQPIELRRNYRITSVGSSRNEILDNYVAQQPERHAMADHRVQSLIDSLQFMMETSISPNGNGTTMENRSLPIIWWWKRNPIGTMFD